MIERTYSRHIGDHADALARAALLDTSAPMAGNVVPIRAWRRRWAHPLSATASRSGGYYQEPGRRFCGQAKPAPADTESTTTVTTKTGRRCGC